MDFCCWTICVTFPRARIWRRIFSFFLIRWKHPLSSWPGKRQQRLQTSLFSRFQKIRRTFSCVRQWGFSFGEGWGANTCHISSRCLAVGEQCTLSPTASKAGGLERRKYSTGNYRKVRSNRKLAFPSACSAQCAQTAFKIRHGCVWRFMHSG